MTEITIKFNGGPCDSMSMPFIKIQGRNTVEVSVESDGRKFEYKLSEELPSGDLIYEYKGKE